MAATEFKVNIAEAPVEPAAQDVGSYTREQLLALCQEQAKTIVQLQATIANLSETVGFLARKLYGRSREKLQIIGQTGLWGNVYGGDTQEEPPAPTQEGSAAPTQGENPIPPQEENHVPTPGEVLTQDPAQKTPRRKRSRRKELFDGVRTERKDIPVPDGERTCGICGKEMQHLGWEEARSEIIIEPIQIKRVVYYKETLVCEDCKDGYGDFAYRKADIPAPLIERSMAPASAVGHLIYQKFVNSMTFYRMEQELEGMGLPLGRETMASWVIRCALGSLSPMYTLLFEEQKGRDVLHGDGTWCQVLKEPGKDAVSKSYIWLVVTGNDGLPPVVTYHYSPTRAHTTAEELLGDFTGFFHTDKYGGYNCLEGHITRCLCWAHGRRKWYEAITSDIRNRDRSKMAIADLTPAETGFLYCEKLFEIERSLKALSPDARKARRLEKEVPVLKSFWAWLGTLEPAGGSKLEKAVNYYKDCREGFENYLKDGRCSLSNNLAENNARPYVVGRKNFLFHNSVDGAKASAVIYSIVLTAKANNLDVRKYVETLLQRMPDYKNEPEGMKTLLPWSQDMQAECHRTEIGKAPGS